MTFFDIRPLNTVRLRLEPVLEIHATEAAPMLASADLHRFIGGAPLSEGELAQRYAVLVRGHDVGETQLWFNWMLRETSTGHLVGTVQATFEKADSVASVAWVTGREHQNQGFAKEAAMTVVDWLRASGTRSIQAYIHPRNEASCAVARSLGLFRTETINDGEYLWSDGAASA